MTPFPRAGISEKRLITAILPPGHARELATRLAEEPGVLTATHHHARGVGSRRVRPGRLVFDEKDVLMVLVDTEHADAIFALIYRLCGIGERHAGVMFQEAIRCSHPTLPGTDHVAPETTET